MCILLWAGGRSRGGPFPKMWPPLNRVGAEFIGATRKERPCFAAERGLDRLGHTTLRMVYWRHTKGTALFCCRVRPRPAWAHTSTRGSVFRSYPPDKDRSQAVQFGFRKSRPDFATSNSFRKMCILLWAGGRSRGGPFPKMWPPLNRVGAEFIGATRKERPCFAAERGLDRLGHTSLRMVYWRHTKGTALFCCRTRPRPL